MARYNRWQNQSLYCAADSLPPEARRADRGAFFKSIEGTLNHLFWGDSMWMHRFTGTPAPQGGIRTSPEIFTDWSALKPAREALDADIIAWARIYTPGILSRILPPWAARWLLGSYRLLERQERSMERKLGRDMRACSAVLISHERDLNRLRRLAPRTPAYFLRRGIDLERFNPGRKDRDLLLRRFGIPAAK
jgi:hypothetical protein